MSRALTFLDQPADLPLKKTLIGSIVDSAQFRQTVGSLWIKRSKGCAFREIDDGINDAVRRKYDAHERNDPSDLEYSPINIGAFACSMQRCLPRDETAP